MRVRWRFVLPIIGLLLFTGVTYDSLRMNREVKNESGRYFWWSSIRLDSNPSSRRPSTPCKNEGADCTEEPIYLWVDAGWLTKLLLLSALPALLIAKAIVDGLGRLGISEVATFMFFTPLLIAMWFYFVGRLLDRWVDRRLRRPATVLANR